MASVVLSGDTSGSITIAAPAVAGSNTQTLVAATGTLAPIVSATAQASTSGTSIDFTSIPSWVERITVMLNGVSTNGSSNPIIQIGSGSFTTSGYLSGSTESGNARQAYTTGFGLNSGNALNVLYEHIVITNVSGNIWLATHNGNFNQSGVYYSVVGGGNVTLSGTLDRVRITTVNGTDTFDAGTINILYE
jgi:hypothetical protein